MIKKILAGIIIGITTLNIGAVNLEASEINTEVVTEISFSDKIETIENEMIDRTRAIFTEESDYIENNYDIEIEDAIGVATIVEDQYEIVVEITGDEELDTDTYFHEIAHIIDFEFNVSWDMTDEMLEEGKDLFEDRQVMYEYTKGNSVEYFAASYAACRMNPELVKEKAPLTFEFLYSLGDILK